MNDEFQKRQTACKIRVRDILSSRYIKTEGMEPNYLEVGARHISRVNILGTIVEKSGINNYTSITIDDGSGRISARIFDDKISLSNAEIGDVVSLIGKPREFSSEKYIIIEAVKKFDSAWAKVRSLELRKNGSYNTEEIVANDESIDLSPKNEIIRAIKDLDEGDGVLIESILSKGIGGAGKIISNLLKEGGIFEVKPGKLKVLE